MDSPAQLAHAVDEFILCRARGGDAACCQVTLSSLVGYCCSDDSGDMAEMLSKCLSRMTVMTTTPASTAGVENDRTCRVFCLYLDFRVTLLYAAFVIHNPIGSAFVNVNLSSCCAVTVKRRSHRTK